MDFLLARRTAWFFPVSARYRKATFAPSRTDALGWMMTTSPTARPERISVASGPRCPTSAARATARPSSTTNDGPAGAFPEERAGRHLRSRRASTRP